MPRATMKKTQQNGCNIVTAKEKVFIIFMNNICKIAERLGSRIDKSKIVGNHRNCSEIFQVSQNHRFVEHGKEFWRSLSPVLC